MENLRVIAFTHKHIELKDLGGLVICDEELNSRLNDIKSSLDISEIFYIGTCNRVEFVFYSSEILTDDFVTKFLQKINFCIPNDRIQTYLNRANRYQGSDAIKHLFRMSCSLDSLVVGEKEILAQVRRAYERSKNSGFTGDFLKLMMERLVKTAKEVYTFTNISRNPISVVSLAYRKLQEVKMTENSRILIIGSGETNQNLAKYLRKHQYKNFVIFNRTVANAKNLAAELKARVLPLSELSNFKEGFDVMITCTGAAGPIVTKDIYASLLNGDTDKKTIVDLAIPNDIEQEILKTYPIHYIEVSGLQTIAQNNINGRYEELHHAEKIVDQNIKEFLPIIKQRKLEVAMRQVPVQIKEIKKTALNEVFAKELNGLDPEAREVLERVITYMEKKYIKVPMVMAKEIIVKSAYSDHV